MATHYQGSECERLALDVYIKLVRASDSISARINGHLADYNLTTSQFGVLEAIYHLGPMYQKEIAHKILKSTGNVTFVIDNLEKRDLVERCRDEVDRRYITIHLTAAGQKLISSIFEEHVGIIVHEISALNPDEQVQISSLCKKLGLGRQQE